MSKKVAAIKLFGLEARVDIHPLWSLCHLVHYSGRMHTFWVGPFAFVFANWRKPIGAQK